MKPIAIETIISLAQKAGDAILEIYNTADFTVETKNDDSPLTRADLMANDMITSTLKSLYPDIPVLSEENNIIPYEERKNWKRCWLVDPLDGTKEFIQRNGEFTINIALVENGVAVLGVVHVPVTGVTYVGEIEKAAYVLTQQTIRQLKKPQTTYFDQQHVRVVASRSHLTDATKAFISNLEKQGKQIEFVSMGSSLKICLVAEGAADVYPRFGPTMEWDTAAAQAVAEAAGRKVEVYNKKLPLRYNKEDLHNPWFIVY